MTAEYMAVGEQSVGSAHLQPTSMATTVRVADGETLVTDGPFAETKDVFGGYYVIEADDLDGSDRARRAGAGGALRRLRRDPARAGVPALNLREEWGRVLAILVGFLGDFDLAEEATQEAFVAAAERWPRDGEPAQPDRVAGDRGQAPRDRPDPARARARVQARRARGARGHGGAEHPRRAAGADLHLLSPGAEPGGAGGADAAGAGRVDRAGDRRRVPGRARDDEAPADPREGEDPRRRDSVRRAVRRAAARAAGGGAGRRLPDLQRGLRRARGAGRRGDPARARAALADARRAGGRRPARADALSRRAAVVARRRRRARAARRPGPVAVEPGADRARRGRSR